MILVCRAGLAPERVQALTDWLVRRGLEVSEVGGNGRILVHVSGARGTIEDLATSRIEGVEWVLDGDSPHPLADRRSRPQPTVVQFGGRPIGDGTLAVIAGPCAVESRELTLELAEVVREAGGTALRGGAFKPRTSPYSFQGLGREGLAILAEARERTGLPVVTEVLDTRLVGEVAAVADALQVGSRSMHNHALLREVGAAGRPVLLKRGMAATLKELLLAAETPLDAGTDQVVLCERGVRSFDPAVRNVLDLSAVPALKSRTHLPVLVDPSHAAGRADLVEPLARAAAAVGADGILVEIHARPAEARSDGDQAIAPERLGPLVRSCRAIAELARRPEA